VAADSTSDDSTSGDSTYADSASSDSTLAGPRPSLRVAFVAGVTVRKWTSTWADRHPDLPLEVIPLGEVEGTRAVREREADLGFVRLPIERDGLSVIRLYGEVAVIVVPRDSELATLDSVTTERLSELESVVEFPPRGTVKDAVALVAAGVGALRLPHSLARLHARKDVAAIPIVDAPETEIALVWLADETTTEIEEFVGIVRGRTAASSRATPTPPTPAVPKARKTTTPKPRRGQSLPRRRKGR
jgi:DNA-binding transcriptional LysR family regulator